MRALDVQVGGSHYKSMAIQPVEYSMWNDLNLAEGSIVKYVSRWRNKNGLEDLRKVSHWVDLLIQHCSMELGGDILKGGRPVVITPDKFCDENGIEGVEKEIIKLITTWREGKGLKDLFQIKVLVVEFIADEERKLYD